jgi:hypothetical protein
MVGSGDAFSQPLFYGPPAGGFYLLANAIAIIDVATITILI